MAGDTERSTAHMRGRPPVVADRMAALFILMLRSILAGATIIGKRDPAWANGRP